MTYLDYNAGAPVKPAVATALAAALGIGGNPSSVHRSGRAARAAIEDARERVARLVGARPRDVIFTSGGTEANNLALRGTDRRRRIVGATEHPSVLRAVAAPEIAPCDARGVVRLDVLAAMLPGDPALVSIMAANNEVGTLQPIADVVALARRNGALVHTDASQMIGRLPVSMPALDVDLLTISAHKFGGPQGVGALVLGPQVGGLAAELRGGGQEGGLRAGTEAVALIAGFGVAAERAADDLADAPRLARLRDRLEASLPEAGVLGAAAPRLPNTSCITMSGVAAETQVIAFDLAGFAVSAGAACSSGKVGPSHVLAAMGVPEFTAATAIRVSLGWATTERDIEEFAEAWRRLGSTRAAA